ncbi:hypothetical protein PILCRDRAFT_754059 [Piloderma croceum F 1598]|uniref:Uncharacterized protein n=1 Tax=Piloderma croceum (strain F 1598) TaxID=765440 RepID=A0A0C3EUA8_PILCF|nr:hypothetical protein PILCRDRAFT_754059 [Piloderma croceum F 1598]
MSQTNQIHSRVIYNLDMNTTYLDSRVPSYSQRAVDVLHEKAVVSWNIHNIGVNVAHRWSRVLRKRMKSHYVAASTPLVGIPCENGQ